MGDQVERPALEARLSLSAGKSIRMVEALRFSRPNTYLGLLAEKQRQRHNTLSGGEMKLDDMRPYNLDLPHDHTSDPRGRGSGPFAQPESWADREARLAREQREIAARPSGREATRRAIEAEARERRARIDRAVGCGSLQLASGGAAMPAYRTARQPPGSTVWVCARQKAPRATSAPPSRQAQPKAKPAAEATPSCDSIPQAPAAPASKSESKIPYDRAAVPPPAQEATAPQVDVAMQVRCEEAGTQTDPPPRVRRAPCAACAAKTAAQAGLLKELSRTDRQWKDMVVCLEGQLEDARAHIGTLEALVRQQAHKLRTVQAQQKDQKQQQGRAEAVATVAEAAVATMAEATVAAVMVAAMAEGMIAVVTVVVAAVAVQAMAAAAAAVEAVVVVVMAVDAEAVTMAAVVQGVVKAGDLSVRLVENAHHVRIRKAQATPLRLHFALVSPRQHHIHTCMHNTTQPFPPKPSHRGPRLMPCLLTRRMWHLPPRCALRSLNLLPCLPLRRRPPHQLPCHPPIAISCHHHLLHHTLCRQPRHVWSMLHIPRNPTCR